MRTHNNNATGLQWDQMPCGHPTNAVKAQKELLTLTRANHRLASYFTPDIWGKGQSSLHAGSPKKKIKYVNNKMK